MSTRRPAPWGPCGAQTEHGPARPGSPESGLELESLQPTPQSHNEPRKRPLLPVHESTASRAGTGLRTFERRNSKFNRGNWVHSPQSNLGARAENRPTQGSGFLAAQGARARQALLGCYAGDCPALVCPQAQVGLQP